MSDSLGEFAADFLEEAEQHLQILTRHLLAIETQGTASPATIDTLFRSFHTLKGLCGMAGLHVATDVSHEAESLLARVRRHELELSGDVMDTLLSATRAIQEAVDTIHHPDRPLPQVTTLLASIRSLLQTPASSRPDLVSRLLTSLRPEERGELERRASEGEHPWLCSFTPTAEKAAQGVNVNSVREQLTAAGHLSRALPITEGKTIRFAFLGTSPQILDAARFPQVEWHQITPADLQLESPAAVVPPLRTRSVSSVRVDIPRLDDLLRLVGDLVTSRYRLDALQQEFPNDRLDDITARLGRQVRELRETVTRLRLVPLSEVLGRMPLAVRDLSHQLNLQVKLEVEGEGTQVDKALVERLLDPLLHLVRNALSHGLEPAEERVAQHKPAVGTIRLIAHRAGDTLTIRVEDDGRGLDRDAILGRAEALGWWRPGEAPDILTYLCRPGFSTQATPHVGAGRGVGLDVVQQTVRTMGGTLSVESQPNRFTAFTLKLPLSVVIVDALLVQVGSEVYAIPQNEVETAIEITADSVTAVEGADIVPFRQGAVPLFQLSRLFGVPGAGAHPARFYGLVSGEGARLSALGVDRLVGLQAVVVRTLTDPLIARPGIAGATEIGGGTTALILNLPDLIRYAHTVRYGN